MKQCGVVTGINGDKAKITMQRTSACGDCKGCRMGNDDFKMEVEAINRVNASVGDRVEIDMEHQNVLAAAFIAYIIPLIVLMVGLIGGNMLLEKVGISEYAEIGSAGIAIVLTAISYLIIRLNEKSFSKDKKFVSVITKIIE